MRTLRWLREAEDELAALLQDVRERHGVDTARKVNADLMERIDPLDVMPDLGTLDTTLHHDGKPVRVLHSRHTRIVYHATDTEVTILLLWDNRRNEDDMQGLLSGR